MSTSPSPVVFSPLPQVASAPAASSPAATAAGYAAGWAQGVAAAAADERVLLAEVAATAAAEREQLLRAVTGALSALDEATAQMRSRVVPGVDDAVDVLAAAAVDLAEVVIGRWAADDADGASGADRGRAALDRALAAAPEHEDVVVRLNPADLAALHQLAGGTAALAPAGGRRSVELVADAGVLAGDAVADFPGGSVDARIATALGRMRASLRTSTREGARA